MANQLETRYSYISDYLFVNMLNTINGEKENCEVTDLLEEDGEMANWLLLMKDKGILNPKQFETINASTIDIDKIQRFRDQCRLYLLESQTETNLIEMLANQTAHTPLYFDKNVEPLPSKGGANGFMSLISYEMLKAYNNSVLHKIKKCEAPTCYALFIDSNGKRKWCSMEVCGNRTKARNHYAKKKRTN